MNRFLPSANCANLWTNVSNHSKAHNRLACPRRHWQLTCVCKVVLYRISISSPGVVSCFFWNFGPQILRQACGNSWKALSKQEFPQVLKKYNLCLNAVALWHGLLIHIFKAMPVCRRWLMLFEASFEASSQTFHLELSTQAANAAKLGGFPVVLPPVAWRRHRRGEHQRSKSGFARASKWPW